MHGPEPATSEPRPEDTQPMTAPVESEAADHVIRLRLNRPERRNALGAEMAAAIAAALEAAVAGGARVIVLGARTDGRTWAAGQDIGECANDGPDPEAWDSSMRALVRAVRAVPVPIIAEVHGGVWGGAVEMVLACDIIVATPVSTFALTPALVGVPYSVTGLANLSRSVGRALLREMLYTGRPVEAARALAAGLVNHVVEADAQPAFVDELAARIAGNAPAGIRALKAGLQALEAEPQLPAELAEQVAVARRDAWQAEDYQEGVRAFTEKRRPAFRGR